MKRSALSCLVAISLFSTAAQASVDDVLNSPFFSDSHAELSLKNYWKYLKEDAANPKEVHNAWGQGLALGYQSGYLADFIGVNLDYYSAVKLGASDYFNTRGCYITTVPATAKRMLLATARWANAISS